jgi:Xaa-Pro aminopeptidase
MEYKKNLNSLKERMKDEKIDAFIISMSDPHLSEYVAEHWKVIKWISGFSGSSGTIVVTKDFAGLWTDSRYFIQAEDQLKGVGIELVRLKIPHTPEYLKWIEENLPDGSTIAFDGKVFPVHQVKIMESLFIYKKFRLKADFDPIPELWKDRPSIPKNEIFLHDLKYSGKGPYEKLKELRSQMQKQDIEYQLLSSLDDIAWLFNIRGKDIPYVPVVICFALITQPDAFLFIDKDKIPEKVSKQLKKDSVQLKPYDEVYSYLSEIEFCKKISLQSSKTNYALFKAIPEDCNIVDQLNYTTLLKASKNTTEIANIRKSMVKDGVALVKFFYWLDQTIGKEKITEISASDKLRSFRAEQEGFFDESFAPISAYNAHAAMPHYSATSVTNVELRPDGIYLIDSGAQYYGGTTDITRTICLGNPTQQQKDDFTLALKGTIDLAMAKFPLGTKGHQLDAIARKPLWDNNMNFGHGTGHGVGYFLNVHEGPQSISTSASNDVSAVLIPGMIISDEPAFYREGEYGFRTENLLLVVEDTENEFGKFLKFETLTLCPIDTSLINKELLDKKEVDWLNDYYKIIFERLSPYLSEEEMIWLKGYAGTF